MRRLTSRFATLTLAFCAGASLVADAHAVPLVMPQYAAPVIAVAADCYAVGQEVAAQKGGTLAKASQATRGGQSVCVIVVLVPGKEGERPRRAEIVVPQG